MFLALPFEVPGPAYASCIVGGMATPTAWKILPHTPWLWLLMERRLPSSSMVTRCRAFKSCLISAHSKRWPAFDRRRSSSLRRTRARKLQNTWPRIVRSFWWKIGRVVSSDLTSRKTFSTRHSSLYFRATCSAERSVLVLSTHLPSKRASYLIRFSSMLVLPFSIFTYLRKPLLPTRLLGPFLSCWVSARTMASRSAASLRCWLGLTHTMYRQPSISTCLTFSGAGLFGSLLSGHTFL